MGKRPFWMVGAAFLAAPLAAAIMISVGIVLRSDNPLVDEAAGPLVLHLAGFLCLAYAAAAAGTLPLAVPVYFVLRFFGQVNLGTILFCGAGIGWADAVFLQNSPIPLVADFRVMLPAGCGSALVFWLVWRRRFQ